MKNILLTILVMGCPHSGNAASSTRFECGTLNSTTILDVIPSSALKVNIAVSKRIQIGPYMDPMYYGGQLEGQWTILHNGVGLIKAAGKLTSSEGNQHDQYSEMTLFLNESTLYEKVTTQSGSYQRQEKCKQK